MRKSKLLFLIIITICGLIYGYLQIPSKSEYVKFQNRMSMDWGYEDALAMLRLATYKGGTVEDRAFNIIVLLNKVVADDKHRSVEWWAKREICSKGEITGTQFDNIIVDDKSKEALDMIVYQGWDETEGILDYR